MNRNSKLTIGIATLWLAGVHAMSAQDKYAVKVPNGVLCENSAEAGSAANRRYSTQSPAAGRTERWASVHRSRHGSDRCRRQREITLVFDVGIGSVD